MADFMARLQRILHPSRWTTHPLAPVLLVALAAAVIGLAIPPRSTDAEAGPGSSGNPAESRLAPAENLDAFRSLSRWGTQIRSVEDAQSGSLDPSLSGLNEELVKLGFVALSLAADDNAVILTHPDGHTIRLTEGESLPDGRTLASVTDNALTLEDSTGQRETLVLFPRRAASPASD